MTRLREHGPAHAGLRLLLAIVVLSLAMGGTLRGQIHTHDDSGADHADHGLLTGAEDDSGASSDDDPAAESLHFHHVHAPVLMSGPDAPLAGLSDFTTVPIAEDHSVPRLSSTIGTPHRPPIA